MKVVVLREHREPKDLSRTIDIQRGVGTWAASQDFSTFLGRRSTAQ